MTSGVIRTPLLDTWGLSITRRPYSSLSSMVSQFIFSLRGRFLLPDCKSITVLLSNFVFLGSTCSPKRGPFPPMTFRASSCVCTSLLFLGSHLGSDSTLRTSPSSSLSQAVWYASFSSSAGQGTFLGDIGEVFSSISNWELRSSPETKGSPFVMCPNSSIMFASITCCSNIPVSLSSCSKIRKASGSIPNCLASAFIFPPYFQPVGSLLLVTPGYFPSIVCSGDTPGAKIPEIRLASIRPSSSSMFGLSSGESLSGGV